MPATGSKSFEPGVSASPTRAARLARARMYPYPFPKGSFLYRKEGPAAFQIAQTKGRTPVLAFGSNQSPEQLARKFGDDARHEIPVQRARLHDFDVVYSAHITSYGAVPAMLQHVPGAVVDLAVTWLDDTQLDIMHQSETRAANYIFAAFDDVRLEFPESHTETTAFAYVGQHGQLTRGGLGLALADIQCGNRIHEAVTTAQALELIRERLAGEMEAEEFVLALIEDIGFRRTITAALNENALPFSFPVRPV